MLLKGGYTISFEKSPESATLINGYVEISDGAPVIAGFVLE